MDWIHQIRPHEILSTIAIAFLAWRMWIHQMKPRTKDTISDSLKAIVNVLSSKSEYYRGHSKRVSLIAGAICDSLGVSDKDKEIVVEAGALHDIGKIRLDLALLDKVEKLTACEYEKIQDHCVVGHDVLQEFNIGTDIITAVLYHHENWDSTGYPIQIGGDNIPLAARILRIADSIDAMGSDRAYRKGIPYDQIAEELKRCSGTHYDPDIIHVCTNGLSNRIKLILAKQRV